MTLLFGTNGKGGAQTLVPEADTPTWPASARFADGVLPLLERRGLRAPAA